MRARPTRSSPGPSARTFNPLFTPPPPRPIRHASTPPPQTPLPALFTPPTRSEIEAEITLSQQEKAGHPGLPVPPVHPPRRPAPRPASSAVKQMIPRYPQHASAVSQPAPRNPASLLKAQPKTATAQSQGAGEGTSSSTQVSLPVNKGPFSNFALDRRGFPILDQRTVPRPALDSSGSMFLCLRSFPAY